VIHYQQSESFASALAAELNDSRPASAWCVSADMTNPEDIRAMAADVAESHGDLSLLVNNASRFYPTPLEDATECDWQVLMDTNLRGPYFLCQALAYVMQRNHGSIVNIVDVYARQALPRHSQYCISKAGLSMLTRSLADELAPAVRVNGIAPGAILWPEGNEEFDVGKREALLSKIPLQRLGQPEDIANAVLFLARDATYVTGQLVRIDGGYSA
jgi:pteridine reductase